MGEVEWVWWLGVEWESGVAKDGVGGVDEGWLGRQNHLVIPTLYRFFTVSDLMEPVDDGVASQVSCTHTCTGS